MENLEMSLQLKDFYCGKRVFITGHTGFKGSWLTYWLNQMGAEVTGYALLPETKDSLFEKLDLEEIIDHHVADVRDLEKLSSTMNKANPDIVFHLAAQALVRKIL